ncbi:MAG TPA: hypothetical protein VFC32_03000, partial [Pseudolabrys sp.]|nr:hypothetical protein [Pseudolabrys sp.]
VAVLSGTIKDGAGQGNMSCQAKTTENSAERELRARTKRDNDSSKSPFKNTGPDLTHLAAVLLTYRYNGASGTWMANRAK